MNIFKIVFFLVIISSFAYSEDSFPFIPDNDVVVVHFESIENEKDIGKETIFDVYYEENDGINYDLYGETNYKKINLQNKVVYFDLSDSYNGGYRVKHLPSFFIDAAGYYSVSVDSGISGAMVGGVVAGLTVGVDRFLESGYIDLGSGVRTASLMATSSYAGSSIGAYAVNTISGSLVAGEIVTQTLTNAAGGALTGVLFAGGSFVTGNVNRHEMRAIAIKSSVGSSASAIVGATTSAGGILLPYAIALGTVYVVEKTSEVFDKQEEKERIERLLIEVAHKCL